MVGSVVWLHILSVVSIFGYEYEFKLLMDFRRILGY